MANKRGFPKTLVVGKHFPKPIEFREMRKRLFILPPLFFLLPAFLLGQELSPPETEESYYIERSGKEERFIQRLVWEKSNYVYRYEITVEKQNDSKEYVEIYRESRTENFIELSLAPGLYRYRIEVYNLLNRSSGISDWIPFMVFRALQPELYSFSQEFATSGEGDQLVEIVLHGANLTEGAEVLIRPADGGRDIVPLAYFPSGESARLLVNQEILAPGPYRVYVKNPGGLESSLAITVSPPIIVADSSGVLPGVPDTGDSVLPLLPGTARDPGDIPNLFGIYVSLEYTPLIPLYGYLFTPFDSSFFPVGASLKVSFMPVKQSWGDLGLELAPSWNVLESDAMKVDMGTFHLNGLYQWWFFNRSMSLVFCVGGGINLINGTNDGEQDSVSIFTWMFSAGGGIFFRLFIPGVYNRSARSAFFVEIGVEYNHLFTKELPPGYVKPGLGLGWRF
ncbi:MAG: hypothetical protein LBP29_01755 [Treponema sp.]|jgi:hypothetical protein|nr:hypothetical protein [Treponema sp.]